MNFLTQQLAVVPLASDTAGFKRAAGVVKGAANPRVEKVGTVTRQQCLEIAREKMNDLNAGSEDAAIQIIAGTARSMGIKVEN